MEQGFLSENLKYLRKINNLNQDDFAKELGLKRSTYAYQEKMGFSGKSFITPSELVSVKFGYTLDFLIKNDLRTNKEPPKETNRTKIISWRESNTIRLQSKIFGNSLPQNLKYDSIPAFYRLPLTQKFSF